MESSAIITGATGGIGRETALLLAEKGYNLTLAGRNDERLHEVEEACKAKNVQVVTLAGDIRDAEYRQALVALAQDTYGRIDLLFNNAGLALGREPLLDQDLSDVQTMMDTNYVAPIAMTQLVAPIMERQGVGDIVYTLSTAVDVYPNGTAYCASKKALETAVDGMQMENSSQAIRHIKVYPGITHDESLGFSATRLGGVDAAAEVYQGWQPPESRDVAQAVFGVLQLPRHLVQHVRLQGQQQLSPSVIRRDGPFEA